MRFCYQEEGEGITILRAYGYEDIIEIPEEIQGKPVTKLAPYAFSNRKRKEEAGQFFSTREEEDELPIICGNQIKEVFIPSSVVELGNYLFYGCASLEKIHVTQHILRTGRGVFTGCKPRQIEMKYFEGTRSCLKDMLGDIRFRLEVILDMPTEKVSLIFPEYYEEAVENTPARIIENHFNGSGYKYRQCVFKRGIDFEGYDELLQEAVAWEKEMIVMDLVCHRLMYPYEMTKEAADAYVAYLKSHTKLLITYVLESETVDILRALSDCHVWDAGSLDEAISEASKRDKREMLSFLMNEKNQRFGQVKKTFDL